MRSPTRFVALCAATISVWPQLAFAWANPTNISNTREPSNYPSIAIGRGGTVHAVWSEDYFEVGKVYYAYGNGASWALPIDISGNDIVLPLYGPDITVDPAGRIHVVWNLNSTDVYWTVCEGDSWSIPRNVSDTPGGSSGQRVATDDSGGVHVVWHDNSTGKVEIYYAMYDGESWPNPEQITDSPGSEKNSWPDIEVDSRGHPHAVWTHYGGSGSSKDYWIQYATYEENLWTDPVSILKVEGHPIVDPKVAVDAEGYLHVAAEEWRFEGVYYSRQLPTGWSTPYLVCEGCGEPDVAIDPQCGLGCVAWSGWQYRFFDGTHWDSAGVIDGADGLLGTCLIADSGGFHLAWLHGFDIYYSAHSVLGVLTDDEDPYLRFRLYEAYPNPSAPLTTIRYSLVEATHITLTVHNALGQEVRELVDGYQGVGVHEVVWNGSDDSGRRVSSGSYFIRLAVGDDSVVRKLVVVR